MKALLMVLALLALPPATPAPQWHTSSTMYCLPGGTNQGVAVALADFKRLHHTRWKVIAGPAIVLGRTFIVADKGPRAHFDMWTPSCRTARWYGGHPITVQRVRPQAVTVAAPPGYDPWFNQPDAYAICFHIPERDSCPS